MDTKEMKRALTLVCRPVSRDPLTPASRVLAWSVSLGLIISTLHMCPSGIWEHYRLQSAMASDRWPTIGPPPHLSPEPDITPRFHLHSHHAPPILPWLLREGGSENNWVAQPSQTPIGVTARAQESRACSDVINESCQCLHMMWAAEVFALHVACCIDPLGSGHIALPVSALSVKTRAKNLAFGFVAAI